MATAHVTHVAHTRMALCAAKQREHGIPPQTNEGVGLWKATSRRHGQIQAGERPDARRQVPGLGLRATTRFRAPDCGRAPKGETIRARWSIVVEVEDEATELPYIRVHPCEVVERTSF